MFAIRPGRPTQRADVHLIRAERRAFPGPARHRPDTAAYLADLAEPYGVQPRSCAPGHSYGEMGRALLDAVVPDQEPVDLLVLAFSIHDTWPGRATATYLSHCCPGTPLSFAICDQGCAAAFSGLRIVRDYLGTAGCRRALLFVVEQAVLPYDSPVPAPEQHRGVAMVFGSDDADRGPRLTAVRQHAGVPADAAADLVAADLTELQAGHVVLGDALAAAWPQPRRDGVTVVPPGQPTTGVWWRLVDALTADGADPVVAADYDPGLGYLCLAGFAEDALDQLGEPTTEQGYG